MFKLRLTGTDWMVVAAAALLVAAGFVTHFIISFQANFVSDAKEAAALVQAQELNPLLDSLIAVTKVRIFLITMYVPALTFASYWLIRRKLYHTPNRWVVELVAGVFLTVAAMDVLNDAAYLLGLMVR